MTLSVLLASGLAGKVTKSAGTTANVLVAGSFEPELGILGSLTTDYYVTTVNGSFVVASLNSTMNSVPEPSTSNAALFAAATNNGTPLSAVPLGSKIPTVYWQLNSDTGQVTFLQPVTAAITALLTQTASRMNYAIANPVGFTLNGNPVATNNDVIIGGSGSDTLNAGPGNTALLGGSSNDVLNGGPGNDTMMGGAGNDILNGAGGSNTAVYGAAANTYALLAYNGTVAVLTRGSDGSDKLQDVANIQFSDKTVASSTAAAFDPWEYIASNTDLINAIGANPQAGYDHYIYSGFFENRVTSLFDALGYLASNTDLLKVIGFNLDRRGATLRHQRLQRAPRHELVRFAGIPRLQYGCDSGRRLRSRCRGTALMSPTASTSTAPRIRSMRWNTSLPIRMCCRPSVSISWPRGSTTSPTASTSTAPPTRSTRWNTSPPIRICIRPSASISLPRGSITSPTASRSTARPTRSTRGIHRLQYGCVQTVGLNLVVARKSITSPMASTSTAPPTRSMPPNTSPRTPIYLSFSAPIFRPRSSTTSRFGFNQKRPTNSFDAAEYLASNTDLLSTLGPNLLAAELQYIQTGFNQKRPTNSFDATEYLASNTDLIKAVGFNLAAAEQHYITNGFTEHRSTNGFDALEYIASNTDLLQTVGLNLVAARQHYITNGFNEHRATTSFDALEYIASNTDVLQSVGLNLVAARQHYITNGFTEHRSTNGFDALEYIASNTDVLQTYGLNLNAARQHYITNGFNEHRSTNGFDALEYIASNTDVLQSVGLNLAAARQHYITNGFTEHRSTNGFDALEYIASNTDVLQSVGLNLVAARQHYITNGFNEHRSTTGFDALEYIASNTDLLQAVGLNLVAARQHYITNGFNEHRATTRSMPPNTLPITRMLPPISDSTTWSAAEQHYVTNGFSEGRNDHKPVITGDGGNNTLVATHGAIMTGGAGADNFVFNAALLTPATVTDFTVGADHLQISASGFGHGLVAGGTAPLVTAATAASATHAGTDGYFIYDNANTLSWDPTGGSGADAIALVKLTGLAALHASDFLLV